MKMVGEFTESPCNQCTITVCPSPCEWAEEYRRKIKGVDDARVEELARALHEAGRAAVEQGSTVAAERFGEASRRFIEWDEIGEQAREGRRIQARYLLNRYVISDRIH